MNLTHIRLKTKRTYFREPLTDILYMDALRCNTVFHFARRDLHMESVNLVRFKQALASTGLFADIHPSHYVSFDAIQHYNTKQVFITGREEGLPLTPAGLEIVKEWFDRTTIVVCQRDPVACETTDPV